MQVFILNGLAEKNDTQVVNSSVAPHGTLNPTAKKEFGSVASRLDASLNKYTLYIFIPDVNRKMLGLGAGNPFNRRVIAQTAACSGSWNNRQD